MAKLSAGIVLVRIQEPVSQPADTQVLLVHPGGPFWKNKDIGSWSIPKGEYEVGEDPEHVARREFEEELGVSCPAGDLLALGSVRQAGGKVVTAWCAVGTIDTDNVNSNTFEMIWPPRSGTTQSFPEVDRAEFFPRAEAERRILPSQLGLIEAAFTALRDAGLLR